MNPLNTITIFDFILTPIYFLIIIGIGKIIQNRFYPPGHPWRRFFMLGLQVRLIGAILICLLYEFYYQGHGDTIYYFRDAKILGKIIASSPTIGFPLMFQIPQYYASGFYEFTSQFMWYLIPNNFTVSAIAGFFSVFTFFTFIPTALLFACLSFSGVWALFRVFAVQYPAQTKAIAFACLFIPSTILWGTGILKDTICMFSLGWITLLFFRIFIQRKIKIPELFLGMLGLWLISIIKIYILIAYIPAIALWIIFHATKGQQSYAIMVLIRIGLLIMSVFALYFLADSLQAELGGYALDNIYNTAESTQTYISNKDDAGSTYSIGSINFSFFGLIKTFPLAVLTAWFRPFPWEFSKIIIFFNAIETFVFLIMFIKIFVELGLKNIWKAFKDDPNIQFCFIFSIIFGFAVGLTSGNFGTLSRYRIPMLPFFLMSFIFVYEYYGKSVFNVVKRSEVDNPEFQ